jgi:hypothetical protein
MSEDVRRRRAMTPGLLRSLVVLAWALSAVLAGTVAWRAVALIGGDGLGSGAQVQSEAEVAALADAQQPADPGATTPLTSGSPTTEPSATTPAVTPTPDPVTPATTEPATTDAPAVTDVAKTWDVAGGQVSALCRGSAISLTYATPQDGWAMEQKRAGPDEIEVEFRQGENETKVRASCVGGVPTETVESEG